MDLSRQVSQRAAMVVAAAAILSVGITSALAQSVSLVPATQTVTQSTPVIFALNISGLGSTIALGAFDISVNFDSAALSFQGETFGDPDTRRSIRSWEAGPERPHSDRRYRNG